MYIFIINPTAGNSRAKEHYEKLIKNRIFDKIEYKTYFTKYVGHAERIAESIASSYEPGDIKTIIIFGGDGTMNEVFNGLQNFDVPVSLIPRGSGNDFSRGVKLIKSPIRILEQVLMDKRGRTYYLGDYQLLNKQKSRRFVNCVGFGFDAVVAKSANESASKKIFNKIKLGKISYVIALIKQLFFYKPIDLTIEIDGVTKKFHRCFLATVNNQPYFGGGMKINPLATNNNKSLSILIVDSISKLKVLFLFGTVFTGKHINFKEVHILEGKDIKIYSKTKVPYQVDGETGMTLGCQASKVDKPINILGTKVN